MEMDYAAWKGIDPQRCLVNIWQERSFYVQDRAAFAIQIWFKKIIEINKNLKIKAVASTKINQWSKKCLTRIKERQKAEKRRAKNKKNRAAKRERKKQQSPTSPVNSPLNLSLSEKSTFFIKRVNEFIDDEMKESLKKMECPFFRLESSCEGLTPTYKRGVAQIKKKFIPKLYTYVDNLKKELFNDQERPRVKESFYFYDYYFENTFSEVVKKERSKLIESCVLDVEFTELIQAKRCTDVVRAVLRDMYIQFVEEYKGSEIKEPRFLNYYGMQRAFEMFAEAYTVAIKNQDAFSSFKDHVPKIEIGSLKEFEIVPVVAQSLFDSYAQFVIERMEKEEEKGLEPLEEKIMNMRGEIQVAGVVYLPDLLKQILSKKYFESINFIDISRHHSNAIRVGLEGTIKKNRRAFLSSRSIDDELMRLFKENPSYEKDKEAIKVLYTQLRNQYLGLNVGGEEQRLCHLNYKTILDILHQKTRMVGMPEVDDLD